MSENEIDEPRPVDYLVVEFPAERSVLTGEMGEALVEDHRLGSLIEMRARGARGLQGASIRTVEGTTRNEGVHT